MVMADLSKCDRADCPLSAKCYRFTVRDDPFWQSYGHFPRWWESGDPHCWYFVAAAAYTTPNAGTDQS
jgi:hypothetical protein